MRRMRVFPIVLLAAAAMTVPSYVTATDVPNPQPYVTATGSATANCYNTVVGYSIECEGSATAGAWGGGLNAIVSFLAPIDFSVANSSASLQHDDLTGQCQAGVGTGCTAPPDSTAFTHVVVNGDIINGVKQEFCVHGKVRGTNHATSTNGFIATSDKDLFGEKHLCRSS